MKTVLYINGRLGVWVSFERDTCINVYAESLSIEHADYQPCTWLESKLEPVHLVIDNEQIEIDAYPLKPTGSILGQLSRKKALRDTLIDRFPNAIIRSPSKSTGLDALLVQNVNLSESSQNWLAAVEKSAITFCSVASSAETMANLFTTCDRPYLVVSNVLGYCRHTFCRSGHALFTRTLELAENLSIIDGLEETLSHLRTTELIHAPVCIYLIGCSDHQLSGVGELEWIDGIEHCDKSTPIAAARITNDDVDLLQYSAVIHIAQHALKNTAPRQLGSMRYVSMSLAKHEQLTKHRKNLLQLAAVSTLAICSIGYSGLMQWREQQRYNDYKKSKEALSIAIDHSRQALIDENPYGKALSDVFFDTEALKLSSSPDPEVLLSVIATVFTEHRELLLQDLSWVAIDDVAAGPNGFNDEMPNRITSRNRISIESAAPGKLVVNIVGTSNSGGSLREQQSAINAVVARLAQYQSVSHLVVLEAPLTKSSTDDRIGADALDLATGFRFQFQFDRSSANEV